MLDCTIAYGLSFLFPAGDTAVGASLRDHGEFARSELDFLLDHADGGGTFIDVGANIGAIALPFAERNPGWKVLALEAHRGISGMLVANALNNRLHNVEVIHAAVGPSSGVVRFPTAPLNTESNFGNTGFGIGGEITEPVRMTTLDELAAADTRLVKIDVEGFEPEVLNGAEQLLRRRQAIWLLEASVENPESSETVIGILQDAGYSVHWFYAPFATPRSPKSRPNQPTQGDANVVALPPGIENSWRLPPVTSPSDKRPGATKFYPYLSRYGY